MGSYETVGREAIKEGTLEYSENKELAIISLRVLDAISENSPKLSVKYAVTVLDDAKSMLLQLLGV